MMRPESEIHRLAAARPFILERTQDVVSPAEQEQILRQILAEPGGWEVPRPAAGHLTAPPRQLTTPPRERHRRIAVRGSVAAAAVAAIVLAGAALAVNGDRQPSATASKAAGHAATLDAKIVLTKSIAALDVLGDAVEHSRVTGSLNGQPYTGDLWVYRAAERQQMTGPGTASTQAWQAVTGGTLTRGYIYDDSKTWTQYANPTDSMWREISRTPTARLEAAFLRTTLDSGRWTIAGRAVVDGQHAIVVRVTATFPAGGASLPDAGQASRSARTARDQTAVPAGPLIDVAPSLTAEQYARARARGQTTFTSAGTVTTTLYLSAKTYLPIMQKEVTDLTSQGVPGSAARQTEFSAFQWLPATPANLALLKPPPIPADYARVSPNGQ